MSSQDRQRLQKLIRQRAFSLGTFELASGKQSAYYIDSKQILFHSESLWLLGPALFELTEDLAFTGVGGLEVGSLPLIAILAQFYYAKLVVELEGFFVRKQAKEHGTARRVEGVLQPGSRVVILEDVLTTGGSAQQAVVAAQEAGAKVVAVVAVVDRLEGARELFEPTIPVRSIFTVADFLTPSQPESS